MRWAIIESCVTKARELAEGTERRGMWLRTITKQKTDVEAKEIWEMEEGEIKKKNVIKQMWASFTTQEIIEESV